MRKRLPWILFAFIGIGLLAMTSTMAQQISNETQIDNKLAVEPYVVVVYGAVISPARFELRRRVRLAEMLKLAGGLTWWADRTIQLIHSEQANDKLSVAALGSPSEVYRWDELSRDDEKANPYVKPGDVVIVTEALPIYVTGSVIQPGSFPLRAAITLRRAITMAGGPSGSSNPEVVSIYRSLSGNPPTLLSTQTVLTFNLKAIRKGLIEDPVLQPYDIIEVSPPRKSRDINLSPFFDSRPLATRLPSRVIG